MTSRGLLVGMFFVVIILFVPVLTGVLSFCENLRTGDIHLQRSLLRVGLPIAYARAFLNSLWTLWFTVMALPLGALMGCFCQVKGAASTRPPVILVHGLYHNPAAWFVMRRRLRRAGFTDVRCFGYASFGRGFASIATDLAQVLAETARAVPEARVLLVGHSLGGLLIRAACVDPLVAEAGCHIAGVVTLGAPHRGSTLAGMLGMGALARSLAPEGAAIALARQLPVCAAPGLSLYTPTDGMVLPISGALLDERERLAGWEERALPPTSHVGLLYSGIAARQTVEFLKAQCELPRN